MNLTIERPSDKQQGKRIHELTRGWYDAVDKDKNTIFYVSEPPYVPDGSTEWKGIYKLECDYISEMNIGYSDYLFMPTTAKRVILNFA